MPAKGAKGKVKKVVLAYSGGLDTSIILKWLQETYQAEVVTFTADLGQGEELEPARAKALMLGIKKGNIFIEDLREEFVRDYVFPMFRANALYEGVYLLGTSIARPLDRQEADRDRREGRRRRCGARRDRQGQRPGPLRARLLRARTRRSGSSRRGGSGPSRAARSCWSSRGSTRSRSPRTRKARPRSRSTPTCCTPPPRGKFWRTRPSRHRQASTSARFRPWKPPTRQPTSGSDSPRATPSASTARSSRPPPCSPGSIRSAATTASAASTSSRTASSA